jgi:hypothetical protein
VYDLSVVASIEDPSAFTAALDRAIKRSDRARKPMLIEHDRGNGGQGR